MPPGLERGNNLAALRLLGTAADIDLVAVPAMPAACTRPMAKDPVTTFDVFWANLAENYNSTVRKHVDWNALRTTYRPQVTASTTPRHPQHRLSPPRLSQDTEWPYKEIIRSAKLCGRE